MLQDETFSEIFKPYVVVNSNFSLYLHSTYEYFRRILLRLNICHICIVVKNVVGNGKCDKTEV